MNRVRTQAPSKILSICIACILIVSLNSGLKGQGDELEIFALGSIEVEDSSLTLLYAIDQQSGETTLVGETGFDFCDGLESDAEGSLYSICRSEGFYHLTRLDSGSGQGETLIPLFPSEEETEIGTQINAPSDFVLSSDRIGVIRSFIIFLPTLPPGGRDFEIYDSSTGSLLEAESTSASYVSGDPSAAEPAALFRFQGNTWLGQISLDGTQPSQLLQLQEGYLLRDLTRLPGTTQFLSIAFSPPDNESLFLARFDESTGQVTVGAQLSEGLQHLTVVQRKSHPPVPDFEVYVFPIIEATPSAAGAFSTHITLLNAVGTAEASFALDLFSAEGSLLDPVGRYCPGQTDLLQYPLESGHLSAFDVTGDVESTSGWARLRTVEALTASSEVIFVIRTDTGCGLLATSLPSQDVQTTVQVPPVRPARRWVAEGVISPNRESALSLVNPDFFESALVQVTALDAEGSIVDINEIELLPGQRISNLLFELLIRGKVFLLPPERPEDYRGSILIESDLPIAVGGVTVLLPEGKWSNLLLRPLPEAE